MWAMYDLREVVAKTICHPISEIHPVTFCPNTFHKGNSKVHILHAPSLLSITLAAMKCKELLHPLAYACSSQI